MDRSRQLNIRVSEEELALIDANTRAMGMTRSAYIVHRCADDGEGIVSHLLLAAAEEERDVDASAHAMRPPRCKDDDADDRAGAPRKSSDGDVRNRDVHLRVSSYEHHWLKRYAGANAMSVTDFILGRTVYSKDRLTPIIDKRFGMEVYRELNRQGVNLNQMTARLNTLHNLALDDEVDAGAVNALVDELREDNRTTRILINDAARAVLKMGAGAATEAIAIAKRNGIG